MTTPLMTTPATEMPEAASPVATSLDAVPALAATPAAILSATTAAPTAKPERQVRQWVAGRQDAAWLARCRELAEARGLTGTAQWRHIASETGDDQEHELVVPSGSYSDILYTVKARAQQLTDTQASYHFRCGCEGHSWGVPCGHVGAALVKLEARDKALAEAAQDTSSVMGSWLRGFDW